MSLAAGWITGSAVIIVASREVDVGREGGGEVWREGGGEVWREGGGEVWREGGGEVCGEGGRRRGEV